MYQKVQHLPAGQVATWKCPVPGCGKGLSAPQGKIHLHARQVHVSEEHPRMKWNKRFCVKFADRRSHEMREARRVAALRAGATSRRIKLASLGVAKHHKELRTLICPIGERRGRQMQVCWKCGCIGRHIDQMHRQECEPVFDTPRPSSKRQQLRLNMRRRMIEQWKKTLKENRSSFSTEELARIEELLSVMAPRPAMETPHASNATVKIAGPKRRGIEGLGGFRPQRRKMQRS